MPSRARRWMHPLRNARKSAKSARRPSGRTPKNNVLAPRNLRSMRAWNRPQHASGCCWPGCASANKRWLTPTGNAAPPSACKTSLPSRKKPLRGRLRPMQFRPCPSAPRGPTRSRPGTLYPAQHRVARHRPRHWPRQRRSAFVFTTTTNRPHNRRRRAWQRHKNGKRWWRQTRPVWRAVWLNARPQFARCSLCLRHFYQRNRAPAQHAVEPTLNAGCPPAPRPSTGCRHHRAHAGGLC